MKLSSLSPVIVPASSNCTWVILPVLPCRWLSGLRSLSSISLTRSPFWYDCVIGVSLRGLVEEVFLG